MIIELQETYMINVQSQPIGCGTFSFTVLLMLLHLMRLALHLQHDTHTHRLITVRRRFIICMCTCRLFIVWRSDPRFVLVSVHVPVKTAFDATFTMSTHLLRKKVVVIVTELIVMIPLIICSSFIPLTTLYLSQVCLI